MNSQGLTDGRYRYCADGIMSADDFSGLEFLLTEVSSGYKNGDTSKISFDHYKAMFGMLAMIRTLAQKYNKGSLETFRKLRIHFLHAHGDAIRHWTLSAQEQNVYIMNKEQKVIVPVDFKEKDVTILPFIQFHLTLAAGCKESLQVISQLKKEHKVAEKKATTSTSSNNSRSRLLNMIDPVIVRLNEGKRMNIVAEEGPSSMPNSPDHD
ncbi:hypothetical protein K492DRAFT_137713 [Lichtheimia hyalospora FSU 10163]|nr:hypothetical protein K492DRAFT_137713 [Lichtheimia hyalospora FSU 10163]